MLDGVKLEDLFDKDGKIIGKEAVSQFVDDIEKFSAITTIDIALNSKDPSTIHQKLTAHTLAFIHAMYLDGKIRIIDKGGNNEL